MFDFLIDTESTLSSLLLHLSGLLHFACQGVVDLLFDTENERVCQTDVGALVSRKAAAMRWGTLSAAVFRWVVRFKVTRQDPSFPSRRLHCNKMINVSLVLMLWLTGVNADVPAAKIFQEPVFRIYSSKDILCMAPRLNKVSQRVSLFHQQNPEK